ncbi:response regulator [Haloechinothrix sp. LS1_15]|uniref:response regulator n=1 Tax=Haloechinothrix sp. LS1_15 TaxID=2652248 RepID=UPI00294456B3|nr:response regulator [Haloechinothrix sp. LS1_15]MDV6012998.1 response regulator [Haloechinothrix sp. LS1_15]
MINVVVVDDDFMVARVHRGITERIPGFSVLAEARTGNEALDLVRRHRPDLVLLDIYLPDMSGIEVLRLLRGDERTADVDILVITAARDAETVRTAVRGGVVHYIIKPFDSATLQARLVAFAESRKTLHQIDAADQASVDRVFGGAPAAARMPKGLTSQTADLVRDALLQADDGLSASECAEGTGVSRVSARRYLEFFVESGKAEVRLRYGTAGRPERRYHWIGG